MAGCTGYESMSETTGDFHRIVVEDIPLIDVRAPVEFEAGAFPGAVNLPILDDEERCLVGICYKEKGQDEAINLGHQLVKGEIKRSRVAAWIDCIARQPEVLIYCFRGGLRSQLAQQWIKLETGETIQRLAGGYKAFRNYLIDQLDPAQIPGIPVVIGGLTGSGKTLLLHQLENSIDLEAIANHRGSTFGRFITPQPTQIDFENRLAYALINHTRQGNKYMVLEDEGSHIGRCYIPAKLARYFGGDNLVVLEAPMEQRIRIIFDEYVVRSQALYSQTYGQEDGMAHWLSDMSQGVERIKKRLGGERTLQVKQLLESAWKQQQRNDNGDGHKRWIEMLLREYYDPMYHYQLQKKKRSIIFQGGATEVLEFLQAME